MSRYRIEALKAVAFTERLSNTQKLQLLEMAITRMDREDDQMKSFRDNLINRSLTKPQKKALYDLFDEIYSEYEQKQS